MGMALCGPRARALHLSPGAWHLSPGAPRRTAQVRSQACLLH